MSRPRTGSRTGVATPRHPITGEPIRHDERPAEALQCRHGTLAAACEDCNGMTRLEHRQMELLRAMEYNTGKCRTCPAIIVWTSTSNGKKMPVDAKPDETGTFRLELAGRRAVKAVYDVSIDGLPRYTSHFATCPNARQHRGA